MDRAIAELRVDLEHERDIRYALTDSLRNDRKDHETDRVKDRAEYAVAQLQVERDVCSLVGELAKARGEILRLNGVISDVRDQVEHLKRERKNLMEVLERGGYLHLKKRTCTEGTSGDAPRRT